MKLDISANPHHSSAPEKFTLISEILPSGETKHSHINHSDLNGQWPKDTWFQRRLLAVRVETLAIHERVRGEKRNG